MNNLMTDWQTVIFRNYGMVQDEVLSGILQTDVQTVREAAKKLGLFPAECNRDWVSKGFVTLFRNNWDILPEKDIRTLLGVSKHEYAELLNDYDFLSVKLGKKPVVRKPVYRPLTPEQEKQTERVRQIVEQFSPSRVKPFDFYRNSPAPVYEPPAASEISERFVASYNARYGGVLLDSDLSDYPDEYLRRLASSGVNGIWLQETLRNLADFPFDPSLSPDWRVRIKNLHKLTLRCARYGLGVYLYLNEPRSLPPSFFEKYPELRGQKDENGNYCLCTSVPKVQEYLYGALKSVAEHVPLLKGVMTITMSENPTHCYSKKWTDNMTEGTECPHCRCRQPEEVAAELNNIFCRALHEGNGKTKLIANLWGWSDFMGWTEKQLLHGIDLLDKNVGVLCVSEYGKQFRRGGVESQVIDYSISVIGPSAISVKALTYAKAAGHRIWAKIQVNNSWECSAVPYIPAFDRMLEHITNLKRLGVSGLMMGWSLGGYPGGALSLCCMACGTGEPDIEYWYNKVYGKRAQDVRDAVRVFSEAFGEFPFSIDVLYQGGQTLGCANMWSIEFSSRSSTMVCFTFDDCEKYTQPYGVQTYIAQMRRLTERWREGLALLRGKKGNLAFKELKRCAEGVYIHCRSAALLAEFSSLKGNIVANRQRLLACVREEMSLTKRLYSLVSKDAKIGFEMTNHYYYTPALLIEKILNLTAVADALRMA